MRGIWMPFGHGIVAFIAIYAAGWLFDHSKSEFKKEIRQPISVLSAGAFSIAFGVTILSQAYVQAFTSISDTIAVYIMILFGLISGSLMVLAFLRYSVKFSDDGILVTPVFGSSKFVPWADVNGLSYPAYRLKLKTASYGVLSIERTCRNIFEFIDFVEYKGVAIDQTVKSRIKRPATSTWTYAFGALGVLIGEMIVRSKQRGR
ncbi:hypothetical protein [Phenylobacterium montanum]|uniref:Uncharacterized protein n=1 Tax=Phenylobacterium montanum TaxID=2823693 RepID=A0A975FZ48_9CAUL|nr:hypothetical protein [Caulobacter sp. S6]QUD88138.1 hypothetical protein KCG34_24435 [Caulobacter sp. S6]